MVLICMGRAAGAQDVARGQSDSVPPLALTTTIDTARFIAANTQVEFTLSRALAATDGDLAMLIGGMDVTAFMERVGQRLIYRPTVARLPAGATEITVYQKRGAQWTELRRVAVKVLTAAGFTQIAFLPTTTLGNKGQLAEGRSVGIPEPASRPGG